MLEQEGGIEIAVANMHLSSLPVLREDINNQLPHSSTLSSDLVTELETTTN